MAYGVVVSIHKFIFRNYVYSFLKLICFVLYKSL